MALTPTPARDLKVGTIINTTFNVLEKNALVAIGAILVLAAANFGAAYLGLTKTAIMQQVGLSVGAAIAGFVVNFVLLNLMLRKIGLQKVQGMDLLVPYFGLSVLSTLGIGLGFIVLILPGLFLMARWSLAQPLMLARGDGIMKALGESWERTKGNEFTIILAALALAILFILVSVLVPFQFGAQSIVGLVIAQTAGAVASIIFASMRVALYALMVAAHSPSETFE